MKAEAVLAGCQGNTDLSLTGTSAASYHPCETKQCCDTGANHSEQSLKGEVRVKGPATPQETADPCESC